MSKFQAFLLFAATFSANSFTQSEAQRNTNEVSAPFFDEGDNLSFGNCGKWNKSVSDFPPWSARIEPNSNLLLGTIISQRTIFLNGYGLDDEARRAIKNGEKQAKIGKCRGYESICEVDKSEGIVVKVVAYVAFKEGYVEFTLLITERMPEFNDFYSPICLFNRGNEFELQQQPTYSNYQLWDWTWSENWSYEVKIEPIEKCLSNETIKRMKKEEPTKLKLLICVPNKEWCKRSAKRYLTLYEEGRYFLRGLRVDEYNSEYGSNYLTNELFYDFLRLTHWIVQNSPDISVLPQIPPTPANKKFKGVRNLSFTNCGEKRMQTRQKREEDEAEEPVALIHRATNAISGNHPWHAEIQIPKVSQTCGGTLISKRAVLTAAHCLKNFKAIEITVTLGIIDNTLRNGGQIQVPSKLVIHENYNSTTHENDLALMIFDQDFQLNGKVSPICLWNEDFSLDRISGKNAMAVGWGLIENYTQPNILQEALLPIKSYKECYLIKRPFFGKYLYPGKNFCAGYTNGTTVCNGDSGGGLSIEKDGRWFIRGIVSISRSQTWQNEYGEIIPVCHPNSYSLFTDVGGYMDWIVKNTPDILYVGDKDLRILPKSKPECGWWKRNFGKLFGSAC